MKCALPPSPSRGCGRGCLEVAAYPHPHPLSREGAGEGSAAARELAARGLEPRRVARELAACGLEPRRVAWVAQRHGLSNHSPGSLSPGGSAPLSRALAGEGRGGEAMQATSRHPLPRFAWEGVGGRALALALALLAGCSDPAPATPDASVDATVYSLTIAAPDPLGYAPLGPDAGLQMRLGFQGFRYTRVVLVATGEVPASTPGRARLDIEGFDRAEQRDNAIVFHELNPGQFVSAPLMVFANDISLARAVGRRATLTVDLDDRRHRASATFEGVVTWDPTCVDDASFRCVPTHPADGGMP